MEFIRNNKSIVEQKKKFRYGEYFIYNLFSYK